MRKLAQWATEEGERVGSHPINSGCFQAGQVGGIATDTISRKRRRFRENQKKKRKKKEKKKKNRAGQAKIAYSSTSKIIKGDSSGRGERRKG